MCEAFVMSVAQLSRELMMMPTPTHPAYGGIGENLTTNIIFLVHE